VRGLLVFGGNPLLTIAGSRRVQEALGNLDLLVVTDLFMTPTAAMADYVLPAAFWPEVEQIAAYPLVAENMVMAQPRITQIGQCRQGERIIDELSRWLHLPGSEQSYRDLMDYQLSSLGIAFDELTRKGFLYASHGYRKNERRGSRTPSRRVELYSRTLQRMGYDPLPTWHGLPENPGEKERLAGALFLDKKAKGESIRFVLPSA
jgi:anaerobic selenocysteine-containing dehydrogenase